jgi:pentapeptide MXKDX repeat protein
MVWLRRCRIVRLARAARYHELLNSARSIRGRSDPKLLCAGNAADRQTPFSEGNHMNRLTATLLATCMTLAGASTLAQDAMKKDEMAKDAMKSDTMKKDSMAKDTMKKDSMAKDNTKKKAMKSDAMAKDGMKKESAASEAMKK